LKSKVLTKYSDYLNKSACLKEIINSEYTLGNKDRQKMESIVEKLPIWEIERCIKDF
jgi:hypothetical protein